MYARPDYAIPIESDILLLIVRIVALVSLLSGTFLTTVRRQRWAVSLCVPIVRKNIRMLSIACFHAQPVACNHCGPTYYATYNEETYIDYETLLKLTSRLLLGGEVIAAKGIGGYHLICDASNERAVAVCER